MNIDRNGLTLEVIRQTRKKVFHHTSKHREEKKTQKRAKIRRTAEYLTNFEVFWICDQPLSRVCLDISFYLELELRGNCAAISNTQLNIWHVDTFSLKLKNYRYLLNLNKV